ncbi:ISL3 family transposase [Streptomyces sp. NPDC001852]|uniref:ISL3 family transposase n=1 Tax=Streptomyces sp. NPDC001852 TaxID=3364619 RepID=UPI0036820679
MTHALHQDLWLNQAADVAVNSLTIHADRVIVHAATTSDEAGCPSCGTVSARVHSSYVRRLDDSAAGGRRVVVELRVRRFRCHERMCPRSTFVEQAAGLTFRHGRRSQGLQTALQQLALALAGRAGSRLAETFAVPVSRSTLLRLIRALPDPASPVPRVLGIDEFALRKGHVYATVLVDIETCRAVDLLPDRTVETVRSWLAGHPGVKVVCRDRSASYAEAVRLGAPDAIHVADRFHLWQNLSDAVEKTVLQHRALLREPAPPTLSTEEVVLPSVAAEPRRTGRLSDRVREQHAAVHALMEDGFSLRVIARRLGLARGTVHRLPARTIPTSCWSAAGRDAPASSTPTSPVSTSVSVRATRSPGACSRRSSSADSPGRSRSSASMSADSAQRSRTRTRPAASPLSET